MVSVTDLKGPRKNSVTERADKIWLEETNVLRSPNS